MLLFTLLVGVDMGDDLLKPPNGPTNEQWTDFQRQFSTMIEAITNLQKTIDELKSDNEKLQGENQLLVAKSAESVAVTIDQTQKCWEKV